MRVLLVQPDYVRQVDAPEVMKKRLLPGRPLLQLKSVLEEAGHQVTVLDPLVALNNTKKGRKLDLAKAAADLARDNDFNAAGISIYTPLRKEAHDIAKALKRVNRTLPIIAGGPHPGRLAESMLKGWKELDYICLGAAEKSLPSLLSSIAKKKKPIRVDDIAYRTGPETVRVKGKPDYHADMASLPLPGYESYLETVPDRSIERAYVMTMRGCPYWCNFCSNLWKKVLLADPGSVAREVEYLVKEAGAKSIVIYDDCFGAKLEHSREVLEKIGNLGLDFELQAVTRFDTISDEWLPLFREAGGTAVLAGLETGSVKLRKKMNKHMKEGALCEGAELVRKARLKLAVYLLFGYPSSLYTFSSDTPARLTRTCRQQAG